jgi:hypothetical protein
MAVGRAQAVVAAAGAVVATLVLSIAYRRNPLGRALDRSAQVPDLWQPLRVLTGLLALVGLLWLAGLYPVSSNKQFLFTLPIGALLLANLLVAASIAFDRAAATVILIMATLVPSAALSVLGELRGTTDFQDTRGLYAFVRKNKDRLIVPSVLFEPTLRYYVAHDPDPPRRLSRLLGRNSVPMKRADQILADFRVDNAPIQQHVWLPLDAPGNYAVYIDWLMRRACGHGETILAAAQFDSRYEDMVTASAKRHGCVANLAYRSTGVAAYRIDANP